MTGSVTTRAAVISDNVVHSGLSNGDYFIISYFNPSHCIEEGEGYGLTEGKYVKQAYVRAQSDGWTILIVKICASYDSGRTYSIAATSKNNTIMNTSKVTVPDCKTCTQRLNYGWLYF